MLWRTCWSRDRVTSQCVYTPRRQAVISLLTESPSLTRTSTQSRLTHMGLVSRLLLSGAKIQKYTCWTQLAIRVHFSKDIPTPFHLSAGSMKTHSFLGHGMPQPSSGTSRRENHCRFSKVIVMLFVYWRSECKIWLWLALKMDTSIIGRLRQANW